MFAICKGRTMRALRDFNSSFAKNYPIFVFRLNGKYAIGSGKKPRKEWTCYEEAWHLFGGVKVRTNSGWWYKVHP